MDGNLLADTNGDGIALWNDRSSNERNATMSTFRTQPLFKENYLNDDLFCGLTVPTLMLILVGLRTRTTPSLRLKEEGVVASIVICLTPHCHQPKRTFWLSNNIYTRSKKLIVLATVFQSILFRPFGHGLIGSTIAWVIEST